MRFDELSPEEKIAFKKHTMKDFIDHGMSEDEATVNYVFCINPEPIKWLEHKYRFDAETAESLKTSGLRKYKEGGGTQYPTNMERSEPPKRICKCRRPVVPE